MNIEQLNSLITAQRVALRVQDAEPTFRINKPLIETIRDYLNIHDIDYKAIVEKQLNSTNKYCKTTKPL